MVPEDMEVIYFAGKQSIISQARSREQFLAEGKWTIGSVVVVFCILCRATALSIRNRLSSLIILLPKSLKSSLEATYW